MKAKSSFNAAFERANHFLKLYELLRDTRVRGVRQDWAKKFNSLMQWPQQEKIVRVDGKQKRSILILREELQIDRDQFAHDYLSELLRAAIVAAVGAGLQAAAQQ